ncbi:universal stress protein [Leptolyngbya sp. FACHB-36]|uniref:universal stress protein n=1 Tax=Leptolyngbya sp. FACHB-36 TaxID=2692808 RepID=UPI00168010CA|nr:universal stress protein [Leptolyngbya sp. FACHB-36]MBD2020169.1 universal stress protein [Leptolyngbya sp. FACHB-36]
MNILSTLARLEDALGCTDLTKQMVLLPKPPSAETQAAQVMNLVVGYNGSPGSQTALDLTLWIAHQTRLATRKQVTVQVVYVVDLQNDCGTGSVFSGPTSSQISRYGRKRSRSQAAGLKHAPATAGSAVLLEKRSDAAVSDSTLQSCQLNQFEHADRILWQARNLADEWRGSLKTHLRFGSVAEQLRQVVQAESAAVLLLGCHSVDNAIVQQLSGLSCPVLGIPAAL